MPSDARDDETAEIAELIAFEARDAKGTLVVEETVELELTDFWMSLMLFQFPEVSV